MRRKLMVILAAVLLLAGLAVLLYPKYRTERLRSEEQRAIGEFEEYRSAATPSATAATDAAVPAEDPLCAPVRPPAAEDKPRAFSALWEACVAYNEQLPAVQKSTYTADSLRRPSIRLSDYGWEQEVFGVISIPAADIEAPLYLGASSGNMDRGAAILGQTSMPIGGANTNCVIAGHRTWSGAVQFKGLEQLVPGDKIYIKNPWEDLTYEVIETKVVLPDTVDEIMVREGRDLLTVFTCTHQNTRRYLVICERISETRKTRNWILLPWIA